MKKNTYNYDNEINLITLFKIIWNGKIKILLITLISFLVGFGYSYQISKNYLNSLTIKLYKNTEFSNIDYVKELLKVNVVNQVNQAKESNQSNQLYLARFIDELADYDEFLSIVQNIKKIQDQEIELFKYAKLLEIDVPKKNQNNYTINFKWHDPEEAMKILQDTLNLTSKNLKIDIMNELNDALEFQKKSILNKDKKRLDYLKEQAAIAKELNIIDTQLDNTSTNLSESKVSLNINIENIAYYLRGFKAIDKEIELIKTRDYENLKFIEQEINNIKNMEFNFVDYNVYLMETKSLKDVKLILMIFVLLGLIVGVFFVLISNAFQSQTVSKKTR